MKEESHTESRYDVPDEILISSRNGVLRLFFKMENFYRDIDLFSPERINVKLKLRLLRGITNDLNKILKSRGYRVLTGAGRWKAPITMKIAA